MRKHVHTLTERYEPHLSGLNKDNYWEYETYLLHWFGALFTLVEGFNKLKLKDARVQKLFNAHVGILKKMRHEAYHFTVAQTPFDQTILQHDRMNWVEGLHVAIGDCVKEIVMRRANVERFLETRKAKRGK